jgi:hypothetical protein
MTLPASCALKCLGVDAASFQAYSHLRGALVVECLMITNFAWRIFIPHGWVIIPEYIKSYHCFLRFRYFYSTLSPNNLGEAIFNKKADLPKSNLFRQPGLCH